jgi:hypothetical protein
VFAKPAHGKILELKGLNFLSAFFIRIAFMAAVF